MHISTCNVSLVMLKAKLLTLLTHWKTDISEKNQNSNHILKGKQNMH